MNQLEVIMTGWGRIRSLSGQDAGKRSSWIMLSLMFIVMLATAPTVFAAIEKSDESPLVLEDVSYSALPGNRVQIKLTISGTRAIPKPLSFTVNNPARIALDFPDMVSKVAKRHTVGVGVARTINAIEAKGRTRVVLNLDRLVAYETRVEGNQLYIILESGSVEVPAEVAQQLLPTKSLERKEEKVETDFRIANVDFHRGVKGEGQVVVTLSDPGVPIDINEVAGKIVVDFGNTYLPKEFERRMDVVDFATPVTLVDSFSQGRNVRLVVTAKGEYEHLAYQSDEKFTLEIKARSKEEQESERAKKFGYSGERLSLNFQDIEIRAVLQLIADFTGMNMVTSDAVKGNVTLRLQNVPWDQALDIILKTKGLAMRQNGNVILVAPSEEIASREKAEFESLKQKEELSPLFSDLIQINYAKAEDIATLLKAKENSMLSERGNVTVDSRTNALLVRDTTEKLVDIRNLINKLDVPVRQVLIESRIVIASDDFGRDLGVRFGASGVRQQGGATVGVSGNLNATDTILSGAPIPVTVPALSNRLNVNLPVTAAAGKIALAVLGSDYLVDLELSAMQAEGKGEVISSPRVITSNQSEAFIEQGVEIPYLTASSSGATTVSFKKAVLGLKVTPQITPDDRIIMDLDVTKDNVGQIFQGVPSINTREVVTQVLVNNGATVVLGGIYEQEKTEEVDKVPVLGSLPGIGVLFRQTRKVDDKDELLIFVTPKILKDTLALQ